MYFIEKGKEVKGIIELDNSSSGLFNPGKSGVEKIYGTEDKKIEFVQYSDKILCCVNSAFANPAIYPWKIPDKKGSIKAVLMDLDGTSVHSEKFWMWIIERVIKELSGKSNFSFEISDETHISGHSVSEHLQYAINKYFPGANIDHARDLYYKITEYEMNEILQGRGKTDAFTPAPGLKNFLMTLKDYNIKIGLVTSGLYNKAFPEIISAFKTLNMGDPESFYDAIITAGTRITKGNSGTLSELCLKPHPWLYKETGKVALSMDNDFEVIGLEDSCAGVISLRLAGYNVIGIEGGNIEKGGLENLCCKSGINLHQALEYILG